MKKWLSLILVFVGLAVGFACKGSTTEDVKHPPTITSFSASPATIHRGESSTLSWNVTGATSLSIDNGVGTVTGATGTKSVSPTETTTYKLTATNADGTKTMNTTVTIQLVPPTIDAFTATPASIKLGDSSTLSWTVTNGTTISIDNGIGTVAATGTQAVSPTVNTTYTLTATNADGTVTATAPVAILPAAAFTFAWDPATIAWDYDADTNTTSATFSEIYTETAGVAGHIQSAYTGLYLTGDEATRIGSLNFGSGDFTANGTLTLGPHTLSGTGQATVWAALIEGTDANGYAIYQYWIMDIVWTGRVGTAIPRLIIKGVNDPTAMRLIEGLGRIKR
jgi:hypothetical protein